MIYLDNSATTSIHPDVLNAMMPYLKVDMGMLGLFIGLDENLQKLFRKQESRLLSYLMLPPIRLYLHLEEAKETIWCSHTA